MNKPFTTIIPSRDRIIKSANASVVAYVQECLKQQPFPLAVLVCRGDGHRVPCSTETTVYDLKVSLERNGHDIQVHVQN
jgi:hypothetical protein